jgi:hypothetical protein
MEISVKLRIKTDCQQFAICEEQEVANEQVKKGEDTCTTEDKMEVDEVHATGQRKSQRVHSQPNQDNTDDVMMTMKLYYYDDVTPMDYEPPGLQATAADDFTFKEKPMNIRVGDVDTPFHSVKLRIKTDCQQFAICEEQEVANEQVKKGEDTCTKEDKMEVDEVHATGQRKSQRVHSQPNQDNTDDVMMTMKLYYYDDVTPMDYEPPGFQATAADDFTFKEKPMNIRVGDVDTV